MQYSNFMYDFKAFFFCKFWVDLNLFSHIFMSRLMLEHGIVLFYVNLVIKKNIGLSDKIKKKKEKDFKCKLCHDYMFWSPFRSGLWPERKINGLSVRFTNEKIGMFLSWSRSRSRRWLGMHIFLLENPTGNIYARFFSQSLSWLESWSGK